MTDIFLTNCGGEALLITEPTSFFLAGLIGAAIGAVAMLVATMAGERRK